MTIQLAQLEAQIILLIAKKVILLNKYLDFINIFLKKLDIVLLKCFNINKYLINFDTNKQPLYKPIYSLLLVKVKILKI